jgi:hypothetical protein
VGKHRKEDSTEFDRRGRVAIITIGKRPKITKSDTDSNPVISRVRNK